MPEITHRTTVPRALAVPFALGYPLGAPNDAALQHEVLAALLALCEAPVPAFVTLPPRGE